MEHGGEFVGGGFVPEMGGCGVESEGRWAVEELGEVLGCRFGGRGADYGGYYGDAVDGFGGAVEGGWSEELVGDALDVGDVDTAYAYCFNLLFCFGAVVEGSEDFADAGYADDVFGVLFGVCSVESADA